MFLFNYLGKKNTPVSGIEEEQKPAGQQEMCALDFSLLLILCTGEVGRIKLKSQETFILC